MRTWLHLVIVFVAAVGTVQEDAYVIGFAAVLTLLSIADGAA